VICACITGRGIAPALAGKPEPLDATFLDYLANCEGKDDNWTVVADKKQRRRVDAKVPAKTPPANDTAKKPEARP
jgi:hypothetical protein